MREKVHFEVVNVLKNRIRDWRHFEKETVGGIDKRWAHHQVRVSEIWRWPHCLSFQGLADLSGQFLKEHPSSLTNFSCDPRLLGILCFLAYFIFLNIILYLIFNWSIVTSWISLILSTFRSKILKNSSALELVEG